MVVLVLIPGEDAEDAGPDHLREGVLDQVGIAWVVQRGSERRGQADPVIELPHQQQAGIRGKRSVGNLDLNRQRLEEIQVERRGRL